MPIGGPGTRCTVQPTNSAHSPNKFVQPEVPCAVLQPTKVHEYSPQYSSVTTATAIVSFTRIPVEPPVSTGSRRASGSPVERAFRWKLDGDSTGKRSMGLDGDSPSNKTSRYSSQKMTFLVTRTICRVSRPPAGASRNLLQLSLDDHKADSIVQTNG